MDLSPQSQAIIDNFNRQPDVTPEHVNNLQSTLNFSPALVEQLNAAVAQGHVREIESSDTSSMSATYYESSKTLSLPLYLLSTPPPGSDTKLFPVGEAALSMGHELQHGFNHAAMMQASAKFEADVELVARSDSMTHDYTAAIGEIIAAHRHDEATAEIAGWNALVSGVKNVKPNPTLGDIHKAAPASMSAFFIDVDNSLYARFTRSYVLTSDFTLETTSYACTLKPGLSLNPDLTLSPTPANIEAVGKYYFDRTHPDSVVNHLHESAAAAVSEAARHELAYNPLRDIVEQKRMVLDMASLGLSEKLLEEKSIPFFYGRPMPHDLITTPPSTHIPSMPQTFEAVSPSASGTHAQTDDVAPIQNSPFFPRTATDDYLEAYCAAVERGDSEACTSLFEHHAQLPHMQEMEREGRELHEAEQQRQREEQRGLEQQRQEELERPQGLEQKQHQERSR